MSSETGQSSYGFHRLASFMRCKQAFAYHEILGLVPKIENEYSGRGTVLHEALRAHYLGTSVDAAIEALPPRYAPHVREGLRYFAAYLREYAREDFVVLDAEREVEVSIGGYPFTRRLDLVYEQYGRVYVMDHKTATRVDIRAATASEDWSLATQELVGRARFPALYGRPYSGFVLNLVRAGAPDVTFLRTPLSFNSRMLASIPRSLLDVYREIDRLKGTDPWLYPRSGACRAGFKCEYLPLCNGGKSWARQYEVTK